MGIIDVTGQKFGRLTALYRAKTEPGKKIKWVCKCDCGNVTIVDSYKLRHGISKSCGCYMRETSRKTIRRISITHGKTHTRLHVIWTSMKGRCYSEHYDSYYNYGGRGIKVCDEWLDDFMNFYNWAMANGYNDTLTIDRIDNDLGYSPENCRWVTTKEQARNRRTCVYLTVDGETKTVAEWAEITNQPDGRLRARMRQGWNDEEVVYGRDKPGAIKIERHLA